MQSNYHVAELLLGTDEQRSGPSRQPGDEPREPQAGKAGKEGYEPSAPAWQEEAGGGGDGSLDER